MLPHERDFTNLVNEWGRLLLAEELFTFVLEATTSNAVLSHTFFQRILALDLLCTLVKIRRDIVNANSPSPTSWGFPKD